jgi:acetylglutamate kinase
MTTPSILIQRALGPATPLPLGFRFSAVACGIKKNRLDLGLIACPDGATVAGVYTQNPVRAASVERNAALTPSARVSGIALNSGNANAMTGRDGEARNLAMAQAIAKACGVDEREILSCSTGVIGVPLAVDRIEAAAPALVAGLGGDPMPFAAAILTTDTCTKLAWTSVELPTADGSAAQVRVLGIAKGSGMIHPNMATTLAVVCVDAAIDPSVLQRLLSRSIDTTFNAITVDGDTSTNDSVFLMASGAAPAAVSADELQGAAAPLAAAIHAILEDLAKQVARDGEGATHLLEVEVSGAPDDASARRIARGVCRGSLFKCSVYAGAPGGWGRFSAAAGQAALEQGVRVDMHRIEVSAQDIVLVRDGLPATADERELARRLREPTVRWAIRLGDGPGVGVAWGCDLTYDYVRINADDAPQIAVTPSGQVSKHVSLSNYSPTLKHNLLVEGLAYVRRFVGMRIAVHAVGAVVDRPALSAALARDLELVVDAGMRPLVLVPSAELADELVRALETSHVRAARMNEIPAFIGPALDRGQVVVLAREVPDPAAVTSLAIKLGVGKLVCLADDQGLADAAGLVTHLTPEQVLNGLERGRFQTQADEFLAFARHAATQGLAALHLLDGRMPHALVAELFTDQGVGTLVTRKTA